MNGKPLKVKAYGTIPHLSNSKLGTGDHFIAFNNEYYLTVQPRDEHDQIIVTEKYDGSNMAVAKVGGKIVALVRKGYLASTSDKPQHQFFVRWVTENEHIFKDLLGEGERLSGDWLMLVHGLLYDIEDTANPIVFFDKFDNKNNRYSQKIFRDTLLGTPFKTARVLHEGGSVTVESLLPVLYQGTDGIRVINGLPEGMVYRIESKGVCHYLAKWVRNDFESGLYLSGAADRFLSKEDFWNVTFK